MDISYQLIDVVGHIAGRLVRNTKISSLGFAIHPGHDMLTWLESAKYAGELRRSNIAAVIAAPDLVSLVPDHIGLVEHPQPRQAFYALHNYLLKHTDFYGLAQPTVVHSSARIAPGAHVAERNVTVGPEVWIESGAVILEGSQIEEGAIVRAGAVIGAAGFQFMRDGDALIGVEHAGGVRIEAQAEIQSNSIVDRAIFNGQTIIGLETKLDGLVYVAHNARIGRRCLIAAQAVISGSVTIGDDVWIGPGAVISHALVLGPGARISLGSVVVQDVPANGHVTGYWAMAHQRFLGGYKKFLSP